MKFHFYFGFAADLWHTEAGNRVFRIPARCFELEHSAHRILVSCEHLFLTIVEFEWVLSRIPWMENWFFLFWYSLIEIQKSRNIFFFFFFYKSWNLSKLFIYVLVDSIYFTKYYTYLLNFRIIAKLFKNKIEKMVKN